MEANRDQTQNSDIGRVSEQITGRLSRLGIDLDGNEILTRSVRPEAKLMYRPPLPTRRGLRLVGLRRTQSRSCRRKVRVTEDFYQRQDSEMCCFGMWFPTHPRVGCFVT